jgi:sterol desaturase/sphingolipid hydroxylase (fatty acid hydroxylase superfamily)
MSSFFHQIVTALIQGTMVISIGVVVFTLMERIFGLVRLKKSRREILVDLQYVYLSILMPPFIGFLLAALFGFIYLHVTVHRDFGISWGRLVLQVILVLFVRDLLIYVKHRIFHTKEYWRFHSIHHGSEELNWLSAARFHPAEMLIETSLVIVCFLVCGQFGIDAAALSISGFVIGFYDLFIHSNLRWTFGPFRYVLVSPVQHRWHHSDAVEAQDKNFAAMFSCIDVALRTFYMPKSVWPETTGISGEERATHPRTFIGQFLYPFKKKKRVTGRTYTESSVQTRSTPK